MVSFSISYPDLIKPPYFADLTQRGDSGWKDAQREGEDRMTFKENSNIWKGSACAYYCNLRPKY
jgi:hypothetical protein